QVKVVNAEELLGSLDTALSRRNGLVLLVELVVVLSLRSVLRFAQGFQPIPGRDPIHLAGKASELVVDLRCLFWRAGDDQRRARLVDQDVVDLVDDRVVM